VIHPRPGARRRQVGAGLTVLVLAMAPGLLAQEISGVDVRTAPGPPSRGSVVWLLVRPHGAPDTTRRLEGSAAGEPLHFEREADGGFRSLMGVPLEGGDTLPVRLLLSGPTTAESVTVDLAVRHPDYPIERLTVAPRYAEPDSAARARIAGELAQSRAISQRSHDTPRLWTGRFLPPRPTRITSTYGTGREFNGHVASRHMGTDYAGKLGAPVRASGRGVVALVADFYLAGHAIYLDHGGGVVTGYFHLSRVDVAAGDTVAAGQRIGAVGRSGRATGPHLHWIARYGGITVDPVSLFRLSDAGGRAGE